MTCYDTFTIGQISQSRLRKKNVRMILDQNAKCSEKVVNYCSLSPSLINNHQVFVSDQKSTRVLFV